MFQFWLLLISSACATWAPSPWNQAVDSVLQERRLHSGFRETVVVKWFRLTPDLAKLHEAHVPGFQLKVLDEGERWVVALSLAGQSGFLKTDLRWEQNGVAATRVDEVQDRNLIRHGYRFAWPFYRVFIVDFPQKGTSIDVLTPLGALRGLQ